VQRLGLSAVPLGRAGPLAMELHQPLQEGQVRRRRQVGRPTRQEAARGRRHPAREGPYRPWRVDGLRGRLPRCQRDHGGRVIVPLRCVFPASLERRRGAAGWYTVRASYGDIFETRCMMRPWSLLILSSFLLPVLPSSVWASGDAGLVVTLPQLKQLVEQRAQWRELQQRLQELQRHELLRLN